MDDNLTDNGQEVDEEELFLIKSFGENLAINLSLIIVFAIALVLSMLLLSHMFNGLSWDRT